jgi:hypothetical protein
MAQIQRSGKVRFGDASLHVWEDPDGPVRSAWENQFKKDVFLRIVQQLNRLGWTCYVPEEMIERYSAKFARNHRYCTKGDLQADLEITGRCIKFEMFQNVNAPDRPDYGGRYQRNKEFHMPYLMRLEMERTRRRIRDYLCNVFSGYEFEPRSPKMGINGVTAMEYAAHDRRTSGHYVAELDRARICNPGYEQSADGHQLENGMRVYAMNRHGRMITGIAFYSLNGNWQIVSGRYGLECIWHKQIWVNNPGNLRDRRDISIRRKRLEDEMAKAIKAMNFKRAETLRDILFPKGSELFVVWHKDHKLYHRPGFCGYTSNVIEAGKFTADEIKGYANDQNEVRRLEAA